MPAVGTALAFSVLFAQTPVAPPAAPVRTLLAKVVMPNREGSPLAFHLRHVELEPGRSRPGPADETLAYVLPGGALAVFAEGLRNQASPGEALRLGGRPETRLEPAESRAASLLLITLEPAGSQEPPAAGGETWYRDPRPLPGLGAGPLTFDLTRVTFPPHMPANPPHHRTGDALYVVLSGTGTFTTQGKAFPRPPGTCHFEPSGMVHQWANPGDEPLVLLVANVTREGAPALAFDP